MRANKVGRRNEVGSSARCGKFVRKVVALMMVCGLMAGLLSGCGTKSTDVQDPGAAGDAASAGGTGDTASAGGAGDAASAGGAGDATSADGAGDTASADGAGDSYTIGIGQFAEHGSLDNCRVGFLAGLAEEGIVEGENLTVLYENAQTDGGMASQIADNFVAKNVDLICAIATPMAQSAYSVGKKQGIPIIFTAVTDPVAAELAAEDGTPVGEVTGTSDKLPVEKQLEMIRKIMPDAKKIGILYCTSEVNSESAIAEYEEAAPAYGFEIVTSAVSSSADIPLATDQLLTKVDCLNNLTDNTVVSSLKLILDKANKAGKPVFGSEIEQVRNGCLATVGLDYIQLGIRTGKMAASVLKGEKKASEIPFEVVAEAAFYGNTAVAAELEMEIPSELVDSAAEMFDEILE